AQCGFQLESGDVPPAITEATGVSLFDDWTPPPVRGGGEPASGTRARGGRPERPGAAGAGCGRPCRLVGCRALADVARRGCILLVAPCRPRSLHKMRATWTRSIMFRAYHNMRTSIPPCRPWPRQGPAKL